MSLSLESKLGMSLDDVIKTSEKTVQRKRTGTSGLAKKTTPTSRGHGAVMRSDIAASSSTRSAKPRPRGGDISFKFLLETKLAGNFIGSGGKSIRDFQEVTGVAAHISQNSDCYPGTTERVISLSGDGDSISLAVTQLWELHAVGDGDWNPRQLSISAGSKDRVQVNGRITIPADAAGGIIGKGGNTMRGIMENSKTAIVVSPKEEAAQTRERIITLSGSVIACIRATLMILDKLIEDTENSSYTFPGTKYGTLPRDDTESSPRDNARKSSTASKADNDSKQYASTTLSTTTNIQMAIENTLIGSILGKQGSTLKELMAETETTISVSSKGEYLDGTTKRLVTISGSAKNAKLAQMKINKILKDNASK